MFKSKQFIAVLLVLAMVLSGCAATAAPEAKADLPAAQATAGDYSFENSGVNATNLTEFLNRDDCVYIDLRNYEDYAKKHLKNFEVIPFFALIFNESAGEEDFPQLFRGTHDEPVAAYESSEAILNALFPKDKNLMLFCQSGGRVAMMMKILNAHGYDMSKVYNIGGMAQYTGEEYRSLITDTEEFVVEVKYTVNAN